MGKGGCPAKGVVEFFKTSVICCGLDPDHCLDPITAFGCFRRAFLDGVAADQKCVNDCIKTGFSDPAVSNKTLKKVFKFVTENGKLILASKNDQDEIAERIELIYKFIDPNIFKTDSNLAILKALKKAKKFFSEKDEEEDDE